MVCFQTKSPVLVHFGRRLDENFWHLLWTFGTLCGNLPYFMAIWHILSSFIILSPFWYIAWRKIWQPCSSIQLQIYILARACIIEAILRQYGFATRTKLFWSKKRKRRLKQGCQIFLGPTYQNGVKYTKWL
jgi:hypothetical protein